MKIINEIRDIFRKDKKLFVLVNVFYFSVMLVGAAIALANPQAQAELLMATGQELSAGPLSSVTDAYVSGNILSAASATFVMNYIAGTLGTITLPSLVLPIWAPIMGAIRSLAWGIMILVPVEGLYPANIAVPHYLTLLLEGEAYVIAIFACLRQVKALIRPADFGTDSRLKAYVTSIFDNARLQLVVIPVLAVAALYEAGEVIFFAGL